VALASELATIVVKGSDASEGSGLGVGEGSQFGHKGDEGEGGYEADALNFLKAGDSGGEFGGEFDFRGDESLDFGFLLFERCDGACEDVEKSFVGDGFFEIIVLSDLDEDVAANLDETVDLVLERVGKAKRGGMKDSGEVCDGLSIQSVGLGETAFGFGEITDLSGVDASDGATYSVGLGDEEGFVSATGFADEHGVSGKGFEEGADGFFSVGDLVGLAVVMDVEVEFGDVDADVGFHGVMFFGLVFVVCFSFDLRYELEVQATVQDRNMRRGRIELTHELWRFQS
jgi:hypothetical protein